MSKKAFPIPTNRTSSLSSGEMALLTQSLILPNMEDNVPEEIQKRITDLHQQSLNAGDIGELFLELNERYMSYITTLMEQVGFMDYVMQKEFQDKYGLKEYKYVIAEYSKEYLDRVEEESEELGKKRQEMVEAQYDKIKELVKED